MLKIIDVEFLEGYQLEITFSNGELFVVDLKEQLEDEIYSPLKEDHLFTQFGLTNGVIEWVNGADFAPEFLYELGVAQNSKEATKAK